MSRARELAKVGGLNQQVISGLSTHVGISTFAADVLMYEDLTVTGNAAVGGNLTVTGTTTFNGGTLTLGDAATDNVVFGGDVNSNIIPNTDNAYDLGSSSQEWKDLYVDGTANIDSLVADTADINGGTVDGATVGANSASTGAFTTLSASGQTDLNGDINLGNANTDSITPVGRFDAHIIPLTDGAVDLGASGVEFKDLYIDGTANIDSLVADTADINGGTADNVVIGGSTAAAGSFTTVAASSNATITGNLDVDGDTTLDTTDVAGTLTVVGNAVVDNVTVDGNTVSTSSGNLTLDSTGGTVAINDTATVSGNLTVTGNTVLNGTIDLGDATSDTITCTGRFDAALVPASDNAIDLGTSSLEYKDLYLDGTANIDSLVADTADINGGTVDNVVIGGSTAAAGSFTTVAASSNLTVSGNGSVTGTFDVDGATTLDGLTVAENAAFSANLDVDGATTLDGLTVAEAATFSNNVAVTGTLDVDGATTLDGLTVAEGATFSTTLGVTGTTTLAGQLDANGDVNLGNAATDSVTVTGRFDSDLLPIADGTSDLGSSTLEWQDLYIDGTANIDSLVADTADINGGTADNVVIGGSTAAAGSFTTVAASSNATITGNLDVDGATTLDGLTVAEGAAFSSTLDVDGATTLDGLTVAEAAAFSAGVTITGALDANGGASIDNIQIGVTGDNEIDTASGNLVIDSAGGTTTVDDNLTVSGNLTVNGTTTTINSTTVAIDDKNFQVATGAADDAAADGGGLTVDSGDGDKTWNFEATGDNWGSSENINAASGKVYKINNTSVLSATTLGGAVVNSSLQTLGTIGTGVWQGTAIANGYLANSTVSYGGVSLALGASDATPAFNLTDATNYPTSSLTGTITNAQLAGSIANAKLASPSASIGGVTITLGGTDATPAFDLSDATNYPTSSLSGTITNAQLAGSIANSKLSTISTANKVSLSALNIDGGTDIGAALADADLFIVDDGAGGTNRSITASAVKTYMGAAGGAFSVSNLDIDGATDIGADIVNADEIIIDDGGGGTNRRSDMTRVKKYIWSSASGDATASDSGAITLAASGVSAATYGSSTALPVITVDAKGRITSATTSAIDSTAISQGNSSMTVTDSGTGSIVAAIDGSTLATFAAAGITLSSGAFVGNVTGNVTGNTSGSSGSCTGNSATATLASTSTITANNTTDETVYPVFVDGATGAQGLETDTGLSYNPSTGLLTIGGEFNAQSLDISGNADIDGTCEADAYTVNGTALSTYIAGITVTNASTAAACSGLSATATALATARTIAGVSFDGTGNISLNNNAITNGAGYITSSGSCASATNADTVDSLHASSFVRSDTSDTMSGTLTMSGNIVPNADSSRDLGTNSVRWANVYADDLRAGDIHLSNEHRSGGNEVDGSWGSYVMQEGEHDLFLKNTRTGKSYKFMLQEV